MRSIFFMCAFLASSVVGDATQTLADIKTISNGLQQLSTAVNNVNISGVGGLPFSLAVQQIAVQLNKNLTTAAANAAASQPYGEPGSINISSAVLQLQPVVNKTLQQTTAKRATFGEYSPLVLYSLYGLKKSTDLFAKNVVAKLAALEQSVAPTIVAQMDTAFNNAIVAYGGQAS